MKGEKRYWGVFLRTLAAFLAVWLIMAGVLTVNNRKKAEAEIQSTTNVQNWVYTDFLKVAINGTASPERKKSILAWWLMMLAHPTDSPADYCYTRVYDGERGTELARAPIAMGTIALSGNGMDLAGGAYNHYILFDAVLTDAEQCVLAETLLADNWYLCHFLPAAYAEGNLNIGQYGEVTGIYDEDACTILPQKLVYVYEDHTLTVMESDSEIFEGAELTTLRFDYAELNSILATRRFAPEEMLAMHRRANEIADFLMSGNFVRRRFDDGGWATHGEVYDVPMTCVYMYDPWRISVDGLGLTYIATLLVTFLAAVWVSHVQIRTLKRERRFTRAVAHDIKTPAAVLRAYAEALHEGATPERQREYLESMMEESDRMAVMVNELLTLSRMEGAQAAVLEEQVDMEGLVLRSFERLSMSFRERGLTKVMVNLQPVVIKGDSARLTQAIDNLAVNVLHHAKPGPVEVTLKQEKKRAILTVENQCESISEDALKHLWEPFYKVDESRSGTGSGLGLAVVKNVVTLHGGTCSARTTSDRIEFRIELPVDAG